MRRTCLLIALIAALAAAPTRAAAQEPAITVAVLPAGTSAADLAAAGLSPGVMSPGLGSVPAAQTWLDMSQGVRTNDSLYDGDVPVIRAAGGRIHNWPEVLERARSAPADIFPGLLASRAGVTAAGPLLGPAAALAADRAGRVAPLPPACLRARCGISLQVRAAGLGALPALRSRLRGLDLLVAIAAPPGHSEAAVPVGIAGRGFGAGNLTSDTTRTRGYVSSTDIAPTVLERLGAPVPGVMLGEPIHAEGSTDAAAVQSLRDRMDVITDRRPLVLGGSIVGWVLLAAAAALLGGRRAGSVAGRVLALSVAYLPTVLLLTAALRPSEGAEWALAALLSPALAALTFAALRDYRALAVACAVTLGAGFIDVIAGSELTKLSLMGPNPGSGGRFYGIGNWLEAVYSCLVLVGTGAALRGWWPGAGARRGALAFLATGIGAVLVLAPGRFGADVGAAIVIPVGAVVAMASLARDRRLLVLAVAAPFIAVGVLALIDLLTGGDSHLTRSVLHGRSSDELSDVLDRRLRLAGQSFTRGAGSVLLPLTILVLGAGFALRKRVGSELWADPPLRAAFLGSVAAVFVGAFANDTGAVVLEVGATYIVSLVVFSWAFGAREAIEGESAI